MTMHENLSENIETMEVKYGLPRAVSFCRRCVISNQRPNSSVEYQHTSVTRMNTIHLDEEGICDACRVAEDKAEIDWDERDAELRELCDRFRRNDGRHDCLVPGSGGKDSFFQAHVLKYKYDMHPLTVTWAPHIYTDWGWKNFQRWIHAGFDNITVTPNGRAHRLLTRLAVENLFHPFQPFVIGQKALAPVMSALHKIPLVFYGENEAEYGNPRIDSKNSVRDWKYFTNQETSEIFIGGTSVAELMEDYGLVKNDLEVYMPGNPKDLEQVKTEVHYLGYYIKWHPQGAYYYAQEHGGFEAAPERTPGTYSKYNSIDDKIDDYHYYTTYIKFGIGRTTHDASQEIRSGEITRDEGATLVRRFDGEFPIRFTDEILAYLSIPKAEFPKASGKFEQPIMDREYFDALCDKFRSPHLWKFENQAWALRRVVWQGL
jgi:N-acetyl sugar amidotransferase